MWLNIVFETGKGEPGNDARVVSPYLCTDGAETATSRVVSRPILCRASRFAQDSRISI